MTTTTPRVSASAPVLFALLALAVVLGLVSPGSASAAPDPRPAPAARVTAADLPSQDDVAAVYPRLAGGQRFTFRDRRMPLFGAACRGEAHLRVVGRTALYLDADASDLSASSSSGTLATVYELATRAQALRAMGKLVSGFERCAGVITDGTATIRLRRASAPALGDAQVAYRTTVRDPESPGDRYRGLTIVVLDGRRIQQTMVVGSKPPARAGAVSLARLLAATAA